MRIQSVWVHYPELPVPSSQAAFYRGIFQVLAVPSARPSNDSSRPKPNVFRRLEEV